MKKIEPIKTDSKWLLPVLVGDSIRVLGILGAKVIQTQEPKVAPGYVIAQVEVTDPPTIQKYGEKVPETLAPFNHHSRANRPNTIVIIAFDSVEKAREWQDSPASEAIKPLRMRSTKSRLFVADRPRPG